MATQLRVLFYDGPPPRNGGVQSLSLFTLLSAKEQLRFLDTGVYENKLIAVEKDWILQKFGPDHEFGSAVVGDFGLVVPGRAPGTQIHGWYAPLDTARFEPDDHRSAVAMGLQEFDFWWSTPLVQGSNKKTFSRQNLVSIMANQDGGAHVDPSLDQDYQALNVDFLGTQMLVTHGAPPWDIIAGGPLGPSANLQNNVAFASMRQIAHEACGALHRFLDGLPEETKNYSKVPTYKPTNPTFDPSLGPRFSIVIKTDKVVESTVKEPA